MKSNAGLLLKPLAAAKRTAITVHPSQRILLGRGEETESVSDPFPNLHLEPKAVAVKSFVLRSLWNVEGQRKVEEVTPTKRHGGKRRRVDGIGPAPLPPPGADWLIARLPFKRRMKPVC